MMRWLLFVALATAALPAGSSKIIGNGGDVSVCPKRRPKVQLLDFVESRILRDRTIKLWNPPGRTYTQKLEKLIQNIGLRFPDFAEVLRREVRFFEEKNVKVKDIELEDINDSYHKLRLPGCHVEQIANQSVPIFEDDPWFLINANLWNQLEEFDKAGLVLHEVLYRIGLRYGLEHSIGIRYLNSLLFQEKLEKVTDQQWVQALMHSRIKSFESGGLNIPLFFGYERVCEVLPGTLTCAGGDADFKPAVIAFNPDQTLAQVSYEGIGPQPFQFSFGDFKAILTSEKVTYVWFEKQAKVVAEGRMYLNNVFDINAAIFEVTGIFDPLSGSFRGAYRFVKPNLSVDEDWISFDGNLKEIFDRRPSWTAPGFHQDR